MIGRTAHGVARRTPTPTTITATMTLHSGDIIATGTPAGVDIGFSRPRYLAPGDRVEVSISSIGTLSNPVV